MKLGIWKVEKGQKDSAFKIRHHLPFFKFFLEQDIYTCSVQSGEKPIFQVLMCAERGRAITALGPSHIACGCTAKKLQMHAARAGTNETWAVQ